MRIFPDKPHFRLIIHNHLNNILTVSGVDKRLNFRKLFLKLAQDIWQDISCRQRTGTDLNSTGRFVLKPFSPLFNIISEQKDFSGVLIYQFAFRCQRYAVSFPVNHLSSNSIFKVFYMLAQRWLCQPHFLCCTAETSLHDQMDKGFKLLDRYVFEGIV